MALKKIFFTIMLILCAQQVYAGLSSETGPPANIEFQTQEIVQWDFNSAGELMLGVVPTRDNKIDVWIK